MQKIVKYTSVVPVSDEAECSERLPGCTGKASLHVCFEDGSGLYVCQSCFERRLDECTWSTDSTIKLAS